MRRVFVLGGQDKIARDVFPMNLSRGALPFCFPTEQSNEIKQTQNSAPSPPHEILRPSCVCAYCLHHPSDDDDKRSAYSENDRP